MYNFTNFQWSVTRQRWLKMYLAASYFMRQLYLIKRSINFGCNWQRIHTESVSRFPVNFLSPSSKPHSQAEQKTWSPFSLYLVQHVYFLYVSFPLHVLKFFFQFLQLHQIKIIFPLLTHKNILGTCFLLYEVTNVWWWCRVESRIL